MAKVAVLVPYEEMCEIAEPMVRQYQHITPMCVEYSQTESIAQRAKELVEQGCELILARGLQARLIKKTVKIPVIEIRVTAQALGKLILELRHELNIPHPKLGFVASADMMCNTDEFDELFDVILERYTVDSWEDLETAVDQAIEEGCQAVIGGEVVCNRAQERDFPYRFIESSEESLQAALSIAKRVCYAIDLEKENSAEMNTMLDFTFSGIMRIDQEGTILRANRVAYNLLNQMPRDLLGRDVLEALPQLGQENVEKALRDGKEAYGFLVPIENRAVIVNVAPILIDGAITGAILTLQEGERIIEIDSELRRELYQRGFIARHTFRRMVCESKETVQLVNQAKRIAKYSAPVLITGESGCGKGVLAQCIHNESLAKRNAFISIDCSAYQDETLDTMLFGNYYTSRKDSAPCLVEMVQHGTLYLSHVEALSIELQHKILGLIQGKFIHNSSHQPVSTNVRVIASSDVNLIVRVEKREFRSDLYYALSVLSLEVLPLRRRREDILGWVDFFLNDWQKRYKCYVNLTQGARDYLENYQWPGNLDQLSSLCERIVLLAEKRNIDEVFLRRQLEQVSPKVMPNTEQVVLFKDKKAVQIAELLRKHNGNRQKVADEMGISKTTLWRYIKKYGIEQDYSF